MQNFEQILQRKLIPRAKAGAAERIIVARKRMSLATVPSGVELKYRKLEGKRIITKGGRLYGNTRRISAKWPEAGMHEAENARLVCVIDGTINFQAGNYLLGCKEGDFILIPPRLPYPGDKYLPRLLSSRIPNHPFVLLWMVQYRRGLHCYISRYENGKRYIDTMENGLFLDGKIIELFDLLMEEATGEKNDLLCDGLFLAFIVALQREVEEMRYLHPGPVAESEEVTSSKNDFTGQLEDYIKKHLNQPLTSELVARELYMSRAQFVRRIRKETGQTFVEFLNKYRIQQAKTLLVESEWTVQVIAKYIGFKSSTYFHAFFQRQVGCTPGEFRLKNSIATPSLKK
jgi:AraC-like DNA-binding protein